MRQKITNKLHLAVEGADLTGATHLEVYVRQGLRTFFQYTPEVLSSAELLVTIPYEDAMRLMGSACQLQLAFTDANGNPQATEPKEVSVGVLLKEMGYDPT